MIFRNFLKKNVLHLKSISYNSKNIQLFQLSHSISSNWREFIWNLQASIFYPCGGDDTWRSHFQWNLFPAFLPSLKEIFIRSRRMEGSRWFQNAFWIDNFHSTSLLERRKANESTERDLNSLFMFSLKLKCSKRCHGSEKLQPYALFFTSLHCKTIFLWTHESFRFTLNALFEFILVKIKEKTFFACQKMKNILGAFTAAIFVLHN